MKIAFLVHSIYGIGGTNRTVINLAEALSDSHHVRIVSVFRRNGTMFDVSPRIAVTSLVDMRPDYVDLTNPALVQPSAEVPSDEEFYGQYSALTDASIRRFLTRTDADIVIGTRPSLNLFVARYAPDSAMRLAQEHMTHDLIAPGVRSQMRDYYGRLDAAVTLTDSDARLFAKMTPVPGLHIATIPNSIPPSPLSPADSSVKTVIAAGRLDPIKRYDLLVHAFGRVIEQRPDWSLRLYGGGPDGPALRRLIGELGLHNHVFLMGRAPRMDSEWVKGSIAASSSMRESFGMTIVEAMRAGLPVVSSDCPSGPREIIDDGVDGFLVPVDDADALAARLLLLIGDDAMRRRMGGAACISAARFDPSVVATAYDDLFSRLVVGRRPARRPTPWRRIDVRQPLTRVISAAAARTHALRPHQDIDCVVDADGTIDVRARLHRQRATDMALVVRNRDDSGESGHLRLPLTSAGTLATCRIAAGSMAEARWNVYLQRGNVTTRATPGTLDLRKALSEPVTVGGKLIRALPYRTADGFLAIRTWIRDIHFELSTIEYEKDMLAVSGRLHGAHAHGEMTLCAHRRVAVASAVVPGVIRDDGMVRFLLPLHDLVDVRLSRRDDWDLSVHAEHVDRTVPVARLLDDVPERKRTFVYPSIYIADDCPIDLAAESPSSSVRVKPYLTPASHLALAVVDDAR